MAAKSQRHSSKGEAAMGGAEAAVQMCLESVKGVTADA